jgi:hypothetical protein
MVRAKATLAVEHGSISKVADLKVKTRLPKNAALYRTMIEDSRLSVEDDRPLYNEILSRVTAVFTQFEILKKVPTGFTLLIRSGYTPIYYSSEAHTGAQRKIFSAGIDTNTSLALFWGFLPCYIVMKACGKMQIWMYTLEAFMKHKSKLWNSLGFFNIHNIQLIEPNFASDDWEVFNEAQLKDTFLPTVFTHGCFVIQMLTCPDDSYYRFDSPVPNDTNLIDLAVNNMIKICSTGCVQTISQHGAGIFQGAAASLGYADPGIFLDYISGILSKLIKFSTHRQQMTLNYMSSSTHTLSRPEPARRVTSSAAYSSTTLSLPGSATCLPFSMGTPPPSTTTSPVLFTSISEEDSSNSSPCSSATLPLLADNFLTDLLENAEPPIQNAFFEGHQEVREGRRVNQDFGSFF